MSNTVEQSCHDHYRYAFHLDVTAVPRAQSAATTDAVKRVVGATRQLDELQRKSLR